MRNIGSLFLSMVKVGVIGFGGGNALIPVIEQEAVIEKKLVTKEEYDKDVIAATLTPGALPVEIASGVGLQSCGIAGMLAGGIGMALPGALCTVLLMSVLSQLNASIMEQIQYAAIGVTAFIMCVLTEYIISTVKSYSKSRFRVILWCIIVGVFLATGARTMLQILGIDISVPKLSTIQILLLTLLGSIVVGALRKTTGKKKVSHLTMKPLFVRLGTWIIFFGVLSIPAFFISARGTVMYDLHGLASSLLSFGGGDAYLTIADGLFIPDFISQNEFYNHLVLLVNVLPGSILCKTLSGVGYAYGATLTGSMVGGFVVAVAGFACSVAASCGVFYVIYHLYDWLERVDVFVVIRKTIRVVVSGLLMTVMANLIKSGIDLNSNPDLPWFTVLLMIAIFYVMNLVLYYKKMGSIVRIVTSVALSLIICNVIGV